MGLCLDHDWNSDTKQTQKHHTWNILELQPAASYSFELKGRRRSDFFPCAYFTILQLSIPGWSAVPLRTQHQRPLRKTPRNTACRKRQGGSPLVSCRVTEQSEEIVDGYSGIFARLRKTPTNIEEVAAMREYGPSAVGRVQRPEGLLGQKVGGFAKVAFVGGVRSWRTWS